MDMSLQEYVRTICSLVDIPVHPGGSAVQSLHVLFTLYSEFKNNPHFGNMGGGPTGIPAGMWSVTCVFAVNDFAVSRVRQSVAIYGQLLLFCDQSVRKKAWRSRKCGARLT